MRAYSAGGVVFRLAPLRGPEYNQLHTDHDQQAGQHVLWKSIDVEEGSHNATISATNATNATEHPGMMEVVLVGRSHAGIWALPKGTPNPGETIEQVAVREVQEETGLEVHLIAYIGSVSYSFVRDQVRYHKQVRHFLFEAVGGDTSLHDHEYDLVEWFPLPEACRRLTYQNEVHILYQAEEILHRWLEHQRKEG